MKRTEVCGVLSGSLVVFSIIPYSIRTWQGVVEPNLTSWALWTIIGLAVFLNYKTSGGEGNTLSAFFGFTNPLLITGILLCRQGEWREFTWLEIACLIISLTSLSMWAAIPGDLKKDQPETHKLALFAFWLSLVADIFACIPTLQFVWTNPYGDRPLAWGIFAVGYGLGIFAIPENKRTWSNYVLPVYMVCMSTAILFPMVLYRILTPVSWREWF